MWALPGKICVLFLATTPASSTQQDFRKHQMKEGASTSRGRLQYAALKPNHPGSLVCPPKRRTCMCTSPGLFVCFSEMTDRNFSLGLLKSPLAKLSGILSWVLPKSTGPGCILFPPGDEGPSPSLLRPLNSSAKEHLAQEHQILLLGKPLSRFCLLWVSGSEREGKYGEPPVMAPSCLPPPPALGPAHIVWQHKKSPLEPGEWLAWRKATVGSQSDSLFPLKKGGREKSAPSDLQKDHLLKWVGTRSSLRMLKSHSIHLCLWPNSFMQLIVQLLYSKHWGNTKDQTSKTLCTSGTDSCHNYLTTW